MSVICYINNQPMTSSQCKLFDLYEKYLAGNATKNDFAITFFDADFLSESLKLLSFIY